MKIKTVLKIAWGIAGGLFTLLNIHQTLIILPIAGPLWSLGMFAIAEFVMMLAVLISYLSMKIKYVKEE